MVQEMLNKGTDPKELRKFAITMCVALIVLGGLVLWRKGSYGFAFWVIGLVLLFAGLAKPVALGPIYKGWMRVAFFMGSVMTHLLLGLIYYFVFAPLGLIMRAFGKRPLKMKLDRNAESYWIKRQYRELNPERYERMF